MKESDKNPDNANREYDEGVQKESEKNINKRGKIMNRRGNLVRPRRYHMTEADKKKLKARFDESVKDVSLDIKKKAGKKFFNPYRQAGIYYGCVQSLYLLGANTWHEYTKVYNKISQLMTEIIDGRKRSSWSKFANRSPRKTEGIEVSTAKDDEGRIKQNMRVLQRLKGIHPYGYKLKQLCACIDVKRGKNGKFLFRLNTSFKSPEDARPSYKCEYRKPRKKTEKKVKKTTKSERKESKEKIEKETDTTEVAKMANEMLVEVLK